MGTMSINDILSEFGSRTGLGALSRNRDGICRLVFDGNLVVDIEAKDGQSDLTITAAVGSSGGEIGAAVLREFLAANLMIADNAGAALGLDLVRDELVLCRLLPVDGWSYATFERTLDGFLKHLERCRAHLAGAGAAGPVAPLVSVESGEMHILRV
jgi:hypothetical protein